jgi:diguanylate cyclase (GGDEF)-like protein
VLETVVATFRTEVTHSIRRSAGLALIVLVAGMSLFQWHHAGRMAEQRLGFAISVAREGGLLVESVNPELGASSAGVLAGDRLVAVDGLRVRDYADYDRAALGFRAGQPARLTIRRDGAELTLEAVPGASVPWAILIINTLAALGYLGLGLLALQQQPPDLRSRLLFWFSAAVAIELALPAQLSDGTLAEVIGSSLFFLLSGLQMGLELDLAAAIPRRAPWMIGRATPRRLFYGAGLSFAALGVFTEVAEALRFPALVWTTDQVVVALDVVLLPTWALAVVLIMLGQVRRSTTSRERTQALLVLLGVLPWATYTFVSTFASALGRPLPGVLDTVVQPLALLAYPLAVFIAIFRYRLVDIEIVVRRGLVYTIVTLALAAVALGLLWIGGNAVSLVVVGGRLPVWLISAVALCTGLLFAPLRGAVQRVIDTRVFPERIAMRKRLTQLAETLPALGSLPAMGRHLVAEIRDIFDARSASLLVADPRTAILVSLASTAIDLDGNAEHSLLLGPDDEGVRMLRQTGRLIPAQAVGRRSATIAQRLQQFDAQWALALRSGDNLVGILLLGPKNDGARFVGEEIELLGLFSHTIASVLENVRLFESATYERLTGLLRREAVQDILAQEIQRAVRHDRPLSVGMADIDEFKRVNDRYGHLAGDTLLKMVAQALKDGLRTSDAVGRYGGEEFLFVLPETDLAGAVQVAEKARATVETLELAVEHDVPVRVTISIGLAQIGPQHAGKESTRRLIADADVALLRAKRAGRNRVVPIHPVPSSQLDAGSSA